MRCLPLLTMLASLSISSLAIGLGPSLAASIAIPTPRPSAPLQAQPDRSSELTNAFRSFCLTGTVNLEGFAAKALDSGWRKATDQQLKDAGLVQLRKKVLRVPGGGAPVEEAQEIFFDSTNARFLAFEHRYDRKRLTRTACSIYGQEGEFLAHCTKIGRILNKAPARNRKYGGGGNHFIAWNGTLGDKPANVICQHTPDSPTLPYEGTQLSILVSQVETKSARKRIRKSNRQRSDAAGR